MDINKLLDQYKNFISNETTVKKLGEWYEITFPYLDASNDYIQLYVYRDDDMLRIDDDGETTANMKAGGFEPNSKNAHIIQTIMKRYGVTNDGEALVIETKPENFGAKLHLMMQCLLTINAIIGV